MPPRSSLPIQVVALKKQAGNTSDLLKADYTLFNCRPPVSLKQLRLCEGPEVGASRRITGLLGTITRNYRIGGRPRHLAVRTHVARAAVAAVLGKAVKTSTRVALVL